MYRKRLSAFFFGIYLLICMIPTVHADRIENVLSMISGNRLSEFNVNVSISVTSEPHLDAKRTENLNKMLKHIGFLLSKSETASFIGIDIDNKSALSAVYLTDSSGKNRICFSSEPETAYLVNEGWLDKLTGITEKEDPFMELSFQLLSEIEELFKGTEELTENFGEYTNEKNVHYRIGKAGIAERELIIRTNEDDPEGKSLYRWYKERLSGIDFLPELRGNQTLTVYMDKSGRLLKLTFKGMINNTDRSDRQIQCEWVRCCEEQYIRDDIGITISEKQKQTEHLKISREKRSAGSTDDLTEEYHAEISKTQRKGKQQETDVLQLDFLLNGRLAGDIIRTVKSGKNNIKTVYSLDLVPEPIYDSAGNIEILEYNNDVLGKDIRLIYSFHPYTTVEIPYEQSIIYILDPSDGDYPEMISHLKKTIAVDLLKELLKIPSEDLDYIRDGIPENDWKKIIDTINR